jgi:integral membrane protein
MLLLIFAKYKDKFMLRFFKIIALLEGISLLLLFFFAMPLKYFFNNPDYIRPIGMSHGLLFTGYIILAFMLKIENNWSYKKFGIVALASIIPFGTFYIEKKYLRNA